MKILWILGLSILSSVLYRLGGIGKPFNTKYRDIGCPLVFLGLVAALFGLKWHFWWAYLLTFGLSWSALTTYWDWFWLAGGNTGEDNFYFHGLGCGLAAIPLCWVIPWYFVVARIIICTIGMGLWSKWIGKDWFEEGGRGFLFII